MGLNGFSRRRMMAAVGAGFGASLAARFAMPVISSAEAQTLRPAPVGPKPRTMVGFASMIQDFRGDPRFRETLIRHADIITPMNDLKWEQLRHTRTGFDFKDADESVAFARQHSKAVHGHALVWGDALPKWVKEIPTAAEAQAELVHHILSVTSRYRGKIATWDVVNEVIAHDPKPGRMLRDSFWFQRLGNSYIETAFRTAAIGDPGAVLVLNEYDLENPDARTKARRAEVLRIIRELQSKNIPVHAVGFQAHLYGERAIDQPGLSAFVSEIAKLGLEIMVTELDVIDWRLSADKDKRDAEAAALVSTFLGAISIARPPRSVVAWGISDRSSWISETFKRSDGLPNRPLPFDAEFKPKPMAGVLARLR
jgi:endo-1,4-beta-xylanase